MSYINIFNHILCKDVPVFTSSNPVFLALSYLTSACCFRPTLHADGKGRHSKKTWVCLSVVVSDKRHDSVGTSLCSGHFRSRSEPGLVPATSRGFGWFHNVDVVALLVLR